MPLESGLQPLRFTLFLKPTLTWRIIHNKYLVMKSRPISALLVVVLTITTAGGAFTVWKHERLIYPTPERESAFLKNYSPENAIKPFQLDGISGFGRHSGAGAGHDHTYEPATI